MNPPFTHVSASDQDRVLAHDPGGFATMLFGHTIEGMYAVPEYGGNAHRVGWKDIGFPGDAQPRGYSPEQVRSPGIRDVYVPTGIGQQVLEVLRAASGT